MKARAYQTQQQSTRPPAVSAFRAVSLDSLLWYIIVDYSNYSATIVCCNGL